MADTHDDRREELVALLDELFAERGKRVSDWPADEAAAYREHRWAEGARAARDLMLGKAADRLLEFFAGEWEWNVARLSDTGELWDIPEEYAVGSLEEATERRDEWAQDLDEDHYRLRFDPVVVVRRRVVAPAGWEVVSPDS